MKITLITSIIQKGKILWDSKSKCALVQNHCRLKKINKYPISLVILYVFLP